MDDSFESQVANEMDALDDIQEEDQGISPVGLMPPPFPNPDSYSNGTEPHVTTNGFGEGPGGGSGSLYVSGDHVSCEDLLEFAMDRPNSRRTQGPARGTQSDEVHIMQKVLKNEVLNENL